MNITPPTSNLSDLTIKLLITSKTRGESKKFLLLTNAVEGLLVQAPFKIIPIRPIQLVGAYFTCNGMLSQKQNGEASN